MYQFGKVNYTLYNISVKCIYNDGKQVADIPRNNTISITGGKVEFAVNFNFSVSRIGPDKTGWAYGILHNYLSFGHFGYSEFLQNYSARRCSDSVDLNRGPALNFTHEPS